MIRRTPMRFGILFCLTLSLSNTLLSPETFAAASESDNSDDKNLGITEAPAITHRHHVVKKSASSKISKTAKQNGTIESAKVSKEPAVNFGKVDAVSTPAAASPNSATPSAPMTNATQAETAPEPIFKKVDETGEIKSSQSAITLATAQNSFGFSTFAKLLGASEKNVFISPLSLHSCLHMLFDGAGGSTAVEMAKVLGFPQNSVEEEDNQYVSLMSDLQPPSEEGVPSFVFSNANSLWGNDNVKFKSTFVDTSRKVFSAEIENLDFNNPESSGTINSWVKEKTQGKIPKIIDELSPQQTLVAINAAYFKARWKKTFDKSLTKDTDFTNSDGLKQVPTMAINGDYNYLENDQYQAVELPYEGGNTSLVVILPREKSTLRKLRESLSAESWTVLTNKMAMQTGDLKLPRFTMHYDTRCKDVLVDLGMRDAFDSKSDFSGIVEGSSPAQLSEVLHKTFVKVDEEGTEAAAATASIERMLAMVVDKGPEPFKMIVNRPFVFAVVNWKTKAILFVGQCVNPSEG